jgi:ATP-binding cassette subfamily B protein RaxB
MVANYHGHKIDMFTIRRKFSFSVKGATLKSLIDTAGGLSLQPRPLKLKMEHLKDLKLPCVLHWDMNHFVVLKSVDSKRAVIHDPAIGERILSLAEVSNHFSGVALELTPTSTFVRKDEVRKFSMFDLMGEVTGLKRSLAQLLIMGLVLQLLVLVGPFYTQWLLDDALVAADRDLVTVLGLGFLALVVIQAMISAVRSWITTSMATSLNYQWLNNVFSHLLKLPTEYFEKRHIGDVVSRFGSIKTIQSALTTQFVEGIIDGVLVITTMAVMFLYSPQLLGVACIAVLLYVALRLAIYKAWKAASIEQITHGAKQQTNFLESVRGIQAVRLFGKNDERAVSWSNLLTDEFNAGLRVARIAVTYQTANYFIFSAERILIIWMAALAVLDARLSIGMMVAFLAYKEQFSSRIASLIDKVFEFNMLKIHGERVADIVLTQPEIETLGQVVDMESLQPEISFKGVSFRYSESEPWVIHGLSLQVPVGQCIAIAGASGCGKTTLVKLMLGLLEPTEGEVLVGGVNIKKVGLSNYRRMIGVVMQNDALFSGGIGDNISFFDPEANQEDVVAAAKLASIHDEIVAMPMNYNTLAGNFSSGMSGGQLQRILLARALYRRPKLLVLDEATSHLDVGNEKMVNTAIKNLSITRIVVAHRPETIAMADRVVVLHQGKIVQDGINSLKPATPQPTRSSVAEATV